MGNNNKQYRCRFSSRSFRSESQFNLNPHALNCRHKNRHFLNIDRERDETMIRGYTRRWSRLERGPSDVAWLKNGSSSLVLETLTFIKENKMSVSARAADFVTVVVVILLQIAEPKH